VRPLQVTAHIAGPVVLPEGYLHLDALLAAAVAQRNNLPPAHSAEELLPIEIPVARSACERFHLASASVASWEQYSTRYLQRRFPIEQAQVISAMRSVKITAGPCKSYRIPYEAGWLQGASLQWWCMGDLEEVRALLSLIHYIGKKRSVGSGRVQRWEVQECEVWDGFPVLSPEGQAMRHLPLDYPGLLDSSPRFGNLTYPYWLKTAEELLAGVA